MWKCHNCGRVFQKHGQAHSCQAVPLDEHFKNKSLARGLYDELAKTINDEIGKCDVISLPCCIHLFGTYDFLAALPKKDRLEIHFVVDRELDDHRIKQSVQVSRSTHMSRVDLRSFDDIDAELISWLTESYHLKDKESMPKES